MEYEIADDPQGLPDRTEGLRDGGLREDLVFFRSRSRLGHPTQLDDDYVEDALVQQFGETA